MNLPCRLSVPVLLALLFGTGRAQAWTSPVPDVVVYCPPGLAAAMGRVAAAFRATGVVEAGTTRTGPARVGPARVGHVEVHVFSSAPASLAGLIAHQARDDVVVADAGTIDALGRAGLLRAGARAALGLDGFVLAVRAQDVPAPGGAAFAPAAVVVTDASDAEPYDGRALLAAYGAAAIGPRLAGAGVIGVADSGAAIGRIRRAPHLAGLVPASAAAGAAGIGTLSRLAAPPLRIDAALTRDGQSGNAGAFLAFLTQPPAQDILHRAGLDPATGAPR